jgi:hypothetical protein
MRWVTVAACVVVVAGAAFLLRPKSPTSARQVGNETVALKAKAEPESSSVTENKIEAKLQPAPAPSSSFDQEKSEFRKFAGVTKTRDELRRQELPATTHGYVDLAKPMALPPPPPPPVSAPANSGAGVSGSVSGGAPADALAKLDDAKKKEETFGDKAIREADANAPAKATETITVSSAKEMVTVEAAPVQTSTVAAAPGKAASTPTLARTKRADKDAKQAAEATPPSSEPAAFAGAIGSFGSNLKLPFLKWTISSDGKLLRSLDEGKTWQPAALSPAEILRALSVNGTELWVGGAHGALYYSSDSGTSWQQVRLTFGGQVFTSEITHIDSSAPKHGVVTTSDKQTWTTSDAGKTWQRK